LKIAFEVELRLPNVKAHRRRFAEHAPKFEPDEEKVSGHVKSLVDAGVELVTNVRKQEAAVQTWFVKAFTRDRGVAK
jgi:hypothetical protein